MREITLEELLEAGCHFGHQVTRQNPKARDFVFEARDNIHIIDLAKTKEGLEEAGKFIYNLALKGGSLVVVGTKRQAKSIVEEEVKRAQTEIASNPSIFSVTNRWVGGTLTNLGEVTKNYKKLKDTTARLANPEERAQYTKKEVGLWEKDRQKLEIFYGGISEMSSLPDALFIVDTHLEDLAVRETRAMGVASVGITDTNSDPTVIDYPIPANDDAVGSIKLIVNYIIDCWIEGKKQGSKNQELKIKSQEEIKTKETEEAKVKTEEPKVSKEKKDLSEKKVKKPRKKKEEKA